MISQVTHRKVMVSAFGLAAAVVVAIVIALTATTNTTTTSTVHVRSAAQVKRASTPTPVRPAAVGSAMFPAAATSSGAALISQAQAVAVALHMSSAATAASIPTLPNTAVQSTYAETPNLLRGDDLNNTVAPTTPVWVVNVKGYFGLYSFPHGVKAPEGGLYSVVIDAVNGQPIDACVNCALANLP